MMSYYENLRRYARRGSELKIFLRWELDKRRIRLKWQNFQKLFGLGGLNSDIVWVSRLCTRARTTEGEDRFLVTDFVVMISIQILVVIVLQSSLQLVIFECTW